MKKILVISLMLFSFYSFGEFKHVHMMHVDGVHANVIQKLIESGQMPNFSFLLSRGKISYEVTTVDKSETMKVIPSYLSSQVDQKVVAWWQFMRGDEFNFANTWIDPVGVVSYATGFMGPEYPTIMDFLAANGERSMSGFGLVRRGVEFNDYDRRYMEGLKGAFKHEYPHQMVATLNGVLELYKTAIYENNLGKGKFPRLMHSLLAATDEFAHLLGVTTEKIKVTDADFVSYCAKKGDLHGTFDFFIKDLKCFKIPVIETASSPNNDPSVINHLKERKAVNPAYVLSFLLLDQEVGKLIKFLASYKVNSGRNKVIFQNDTPDYNGSDTILAKTLFIFFSDHGMVDTKAFMAKLPEDEKEREEVLTAYERHPYSFDEPFIKLINKELGLITKEDQEKVSEGEFIGIDDSIMPFELKNPFKLFPNDPSVIEARKKAKSLFEKVSLTIKEGMAERYWYLFFLNNIIVYPKVDEKINPYKNKAIDTLTAVFLKGDKLYQKRELKFKREFFNKHVKLVYGGGARNNAEFFLPSEDRSWNKRPNFETILNSFDGKFLNYLKENPAVELIFIRKNNQDFEKGMPLPENCQILVMDRLSNQGEIVVSRDTNTNELLFGYRKLTEIDPLEIFSKNENTGEELVMNYHEWATFSSKRNLYHHNVVAGIGSYLYSDQDGIGDILVTHAQGYNFGDNSGGHGGVHAEEKKTFMLVSHPNFRYLKNSERKLMTKNDGGRVQKFEKVNPSLLDIAPTILSYLGYGENALSQFHKDQKFYIYLQNWYTHQRTTLARDVLNYKELKKILREKHIGIEPKVFRNEVEDLLHFLPERIPLNDLELRKNNPEMGKILDLGN